MENNPDLLRTPESYNAEQESKKNVDKKDESIFRGKRSRRIFARLFKRSQSKKAIDEMQTVQQSADRTKEQIVAASVDSSLMRKLLKNVKINRVKIKKASDKAEKAKKNERTDGNFF